MPLHGIDWKERLPEAVELGKQGKSLVEIGAHFGVSRQRIKQVFKKHGIDPASVGIKIITYQNKQEKAKRYFTKWGNIDQDLYEQKRRKYLAKRNNAKRTGVAFTIEFGEVNWPTHCPVLGMELDFFADGRQENSVSFDRKDPEKGYTVDNTVVVCWRVNRIKNNGTPEEHQKIADFYK